MWCLFLGESASSRWLCIGMCIACASLHQMITYGRGGGCLASTQSNKLCPRCCDLLRLSLGASPRALPMLPMLLHHLHHLLLKLGTCMHVQGCLVLWRQCFGIVPSQCIMSRCNRRPRSVSQFLAHFSFDVGSQLDGVTSVCHQRQLISVRGLTLQMGASSCSSLDSLS